MYDAFEGMSERRIRRSVQDALKLLVVHAGKEAALNWLLGALEPNRGTALNQVSRRACEIELVRLLDSVIEGT